MAALVVLTPALAQADLVAPTPADCVNVPPGSPCVMANGTAGRCASVPDARRPGRNFVTCEQDRQECDRLAVGAVCHGYLGRSAHCREFVDDRTHRPWRACVVDESEYRDPQRAPGDITPAAADAATTAVDAAAATAAAPAPAPATTTANTSVAPTRPTSAGPSAPAAQRRGCSVAIAASSHAHAPRAERAGLLGIVGIVGFAVVRRCRRRRQQPGSPSSRSQA